MRAKRWVLVVLAFGGVSVTAVRQRLLAQNERRLGGR
jgi:hypothetical protein